MIKGHFTTRVMYFIILINVIPILNILLLYVYEHIFIKIFRFYLKNTQYVPKLSEKNFPKSEYTNYFEIRTYMADNLHNVLIILHSFLTLKLFMY